MAIRIQMNKIGSLYKKEINSKWIEDLDRRSQIIKLLKNKNKAEILSIGLDNDVLEG